MPQTKEKLDWQSIDTSTWTDKTAFGKAYLAYQAKMAEATKARDHFEKVFAAELVNRSKVPAGQEPVFGYLWGKLSIAFRAARTKTAGGAFSLD